jgi:hypothetical protein
MSRRIVFALFAMTACESHPPRTLADDILGEWDEWCRIDNEARSTCRDKITTNVHHTFKPDGTLELAMPGHDGPPMRGTWKLQRDQVTFTFGDGSAAPTETYRARLAGDRLILWKGDGHFGTVFGRPGARSASTKTRTSTGGTTSGSISVVDYTIVLPAGYTLVHDDELHQLWRPPGDGLTLDLGLGTAPYDNGSDGRPIAAPCPSSPAIHDSSRTSDGIERLIDTGTSQCVGPDLTFHCRVSHTRGYLEPAEKEAALALCKSLAVVR